MVYWWQIPAWKDYVSDWFKMFILRGIKSVSKLMFYPQNCGGTKLMIWFAQHSVVYGFPDAPPDSLSLELRSEPLRPVANWWRIFLPIHLLLCCPGDKYTYRVSISFRNVFFHFSVMMNVSFINPSVKLLNHKQYILGPKIPCAALLRNLEISWPWFNGS